jgi:hypothetical protein
MPTHDIKLKKPHSEKQRAMVEFDGNVVAFCGRRFGKTDAYVSRLFRKMRRKPGLYWWVGLSWRSASMKRAWREITTIAKGIYRAAGLRERDYINRSNYEVRIPGLGEIWFRTAENPSSLAGEGIYGAVVDEFSLMDQTVWTEYLQGTLLDYGGWAAFGGVPKGNNWASILWREAAHMPGWLQVHATTYDNPYIDKDSIDEVKANAAERTFRQEYLAEILEDGAIFRGVREAATAKPQGYAMDGYPSHPKHRYVVGVDWGKMDDYSVFAVVDTTVNELCHLDRSNRIDYTTQIRRLEDLCKRFENAPIVAEGNAQATTIELIRKTGIPVREFTTSNASKQNIIEGLMLALEQRKLKILNDPVLISELQAFESTKLPGGGLRYAAPQGMHDDCVMALALAWDAVDSYTPVRVEKRNKHDSTGNHRTTGILPLRM